MDWIELFLKDNPNLSEEAFEKFCDQLIKMSGSIPLYTNPTHVTFKIKEEDE
jgi:hypothetical protein